MKILGLALAVLLFSAMSFFSEPSAFKEGPEQAVIAALQSPDVEAWLAALVSGIVDADPAADSFPRAYVDDAQGVQFAVRFVKP